MHRRTMEMRLESDPAEGRLVLLASTDQPVRGEILSHREEAVDVSAATAMLINHDPDQMVGPIRSIAFENGQMRCEGDVLEGAMSESGIPVRELIESGTLRGVSIGYTYDRADITNNDDRTYTVNRWRLLEVTLTPIPADASAGVRSTEKPETPAEDTAMSDDDKKQEAPVQPGPDSAEIENNARDEANTNAREIVALCRDHGIDAADHIGKPIAEVQRTILDVLKTRAAETKTEPKDNVVEVTRDIADKARAMADNYMAAEAGAQVKDNPLAGRSMIEAARVWLHNAGVRDAIAWDKRDIAHMILGDTRNMSETALRSAANITTASFPAFVNLNQVTKIVAQGFEQGSSAVNFQAWTDRNVVPDFKQFSIGSLGTGNLVETAENIAFPELAKSEGVYQDTVKMWGGTLSLTFQALINDDTGEFMRSLRSAGAIALKTINKRAYQKLLRGTATTDASTWTNNTAVGDIQYATADASYAARQSLDGVISAMMNKVGQDGNPLGTVPAYLICAPSLAGQARGITGGVAPGQATTNVPTAGDISVISSPWLTTGSGLTGAASTTYYLVAAPSEVTGMLVNYIRGFETPQVTEYDAGAVAARKWKIWLPYECSLVNQANSAGTDIIAAAQQGTAS